MYVNKFCFKMFLKYLNLYRLNFTVTAGQRYMLSFVIRFLIAFLYVRFRDSKKYISNLSKVRICLRCAHLFPQKWQKNSAKI